MLRLHSEGNNKEYNVTQARRNYQKRIRQGELRLMFATIRVSLIHNYQTYQEPIIPPVVIPQQQLYNQYLTYLLNSPQLLLPPQPIYALPLPAPALMPSSNVSVQNQYDSNIKFKKNGIAVYRNMLGSGSYSKVWDGRVLSSGERVAVKEVKTLEPGEERCLRELVSDYIIKVIDIFPHGNKSFIALQYCEKNLREELTDCRYELVQVLKYFQELVMGMDVLQTRNIIHRDLKFQNILVRSGKVKIADFGLAKFMEDELEVESRRVGTPYTMAPEIFFSQRKRRTPYTIKSDIWALGILLHEMLYQLHPFDCKSAQFKSQHRLKLECKFGVLDQIIDRCLEWKPILRCDWTQFMTLFGKYKETIEKYGIQGLSQMKQEILKQKQVQRPFAKKKQIYHIQYDPQHGVKNTESIYMRGGAKVDINKVAQSPFRQTPSQTKKQRDQQKIIQSQKQKVLPIRLKILNNDQRKKRQYSFKKPISQEKCFPILQQISEDDGSKKINPIKTRDLFRKEEQRKGVQNIRNTSVQSNQSVPKGISKQRLWIESTIIILIFFIVIATFWLF